MYNYNTIKAQIYYPGYMYMVEPRVHDKLLIERRYSVKGTSCYPDYYPSYIIMAEHS